MPYPAQVTQTTILDAARTMIEREGVEALTLAKLAAALGIRAPSLYNHFDNKTVLLQALARVLITELVAVLQTGTAETPSDDPRIRLLRIAQAYRQFALRHPAVYRLTFTLLEGESRPAADELLALAIPLQAEWSQWVPEVQSLSALRGFWALVHGFVLLELSGQFQRSDPALGEGDTGLAATFTQVVTHYVDGWRTSE
jgi:AcrR family transcriptional regulator